MYLVGEAPCLLFLLFFPTTNLPKVVFVVVFIFCNCELQLQTKPEYFFFPLPRCVFYFRSWQVPENLPIFFDVWKSKHLHKLLRWKRLPETFQQLLHAIIAVFATFARTSFHLSFSGTDESKLLFFCRITTTATSTFHHSIPAASSCRR